MELFKRYAGKLLRMLLGFTLISFAVLLTKQALCLAPWNVLNDGISHACGIPIGQASIWVGAAIFLLDVLTREKLGFGMVLNILLCGWITDLLFLLNEHVLHIPRVSGIPAQILLCLLALTVNAFGIYLYLSARMGAGPRDALFIFLKRKLPIPIGICKLALEAAACLTGWLLGGEVGIGTFVSVLCGGPILQFVFQLMKFDASGVQHESIVDTLHILFAKEKGNI